MPSLSDFSNLDGPKPDVILFDLQAASPRSMFSLLGSCTTLMLIGVSPDTNLVEVWSGKQLREVSVKDLMRVINGQE